MAFVNPWVDFDLVKSEASSRVLVKHPQDELFESNRNRVFAESKSLIHDLVKDFIFLLAIVGQSVELESVESDSEGPYVGSWTRVRFRAIAHLWGEEWVRAYTVRERLLLILDSVEV